MTTDSLTPYGALLLRLGLGVMAMAHGFLKVFVFTIPGTVGFFESLGYPAFMAYAVIAGELLGGAALIAGMQTRLVSIAMIPILIGATFTHAGYGWMFASPKGGWEFPAFWALALGVQAMIGGGAWQLRVPFLNEVMERT